MCVVSVNISVYGDRNRIGLIELLKNKRGYCI
jgi:hypothetical protein